MKDVNISAIKTEEISGKNFSPQNISISILRLDKVHELISGNKWFKLRYYLEEAKRLNKQRLVTAGGNWSNHILATAAAANLHGFRSQGIIRGEKSAQLSEVLKKATELGMELQFTGRSEFSRLGTSTVIQNEKDYFIPMGGYGPTGAKGAATILDITGVNRFTHFICAVGTGTMLAGIVNKIRQDQKAAGIAVLKAGNDLEEGIKRLLVTENSFDLVHDFHFGGYGKYTNELIDFMNDFYAGTGIPSDFVYTGKLFFAVTALARKGYFPGGSRVLVIHSGGLWGNLSLGKGTLIY
jgi:1-aminocyclopropane-1-carboxylate deaminase